MKRNLFILSVLGIACLLFSCSKRKVHYDCQCYIASAYTQSYPLGVVPGDQATPLCISVQHANGQDTCYASGSLR